MTKIKFCGVYDCKNNKDNKCILEEVELTYSYGRSTDYVNVLVCCQYEFERSKNGYPCNNPKNQPINLQQKKKEKPKGTEQTC